MSVFSTFLDNFYGTLFSPNAAFESLKKEKPVFQAFLIVLVISAMYPILGFKIYFGAQSVVWLGFQIFFGAFAGVLSWLFFAAFFEIVASVFKHGGKTKEFLTLSGFALLPWLFLAPVSLFKTGGLAGGVAGILFGLALWLWTIVLVFMAIVKTYELSFSRTIMLMLIPFAGGIIAFNWVFGFFATLVQLLKV